MKYSPQNVDIVQETDHESLDEVKGSVKSQERSIYSEDVAKTNKKDRTKRKSFVEEDLASKERPSSALDSSPRNSFVI